MKGLPLAYNKDMQEDKEPVFDAIDTVELCLPVFAAMMDTMTVQPDNMRKAASRRLHQRHGLRRLPGQEGDALPGRLHASSASWWATASMTGADPGDAAAWRTTRTVSGLFEAGCIRGAGPGDLRRRPRRSTAAPPRRPCKVADRKHQSTSSRERCMTMKPMVFIDGTGGHHRPADL